MANFWAAIYAAHESAGSGYLAFHFDIGADGLGFSIFTAKTYRFLSPGTRTFYLTAVIGHLCIAFEIGFGDFFASNTDWLIFTLLYSCSY